VRADPTLWPSDHAGVWADLEPPTVSLTRLQIPTIPSRRRVELPQFPETGTRTRDLLGYAGSPPNPHWPGGARVAVSIVVNFEEGAEFSVSDGDPENEAVYEIEQHLVGRPDPAVDSHFEYGSRAGWWRIMEVLSQHGASATVSSSGRAVERLRPW
jgi:hypothetical protein